MPSILLVRRAVLRRLSSLPCRNMTSHTPLSKPIVLILGATGTGKSNLAIQIAQSLLNTPIDNKYGYKSAEIVNADAMQIYRGLPIITNKVTPSEQEGIPHHLLDHIDLKDEPWTVQKYVQEADKVIEEIRGRGNLPIVVGGTGYYVYALLFKDALLEANDKESSLIEEGEAGHGKDAINTWPILAASTSEIYSRLQEVDPEMAKRWHPNDRRKIQRSLEIYLRTGRKASEIYQEQKQRGKPIQTPDSGPEHENKTFDTTSDSILTCDPVVFWLEAEDEALKNRLNQRVGSMVQKGLLDEAKEMGNYMQRILEQDLPLDKSKGIWVSIGYKEMEPWIKAIQDSKMLEKDLELTERTCIESVKAGTRQYAKRQNRFIRIRLTNALIKTGAFDKLFLLDCTHLDQWSNNVLKPALQVLKSFLSDEQLPEPSSLSQLARQTFASMSQEATISERVARRCETCDKTLMTEKQWTNHVNSRSHNRVLQSIRKREVNQARIQAARADGPVD